LINPISAPTLYPKWSILHLLHAWQGDDLRSLSYEDSKYLGGDVAHTHLVKGLDFALLQKASAALLLQHMSLSPACETAAGRCMAGWQRPAVSVGCGGAPAMFTGCCRHSASRSCWAVAVGMCLQSVPSHSEVSTWPLACCAAQIRAEQEAKKRSGGEGGEGSGDDEAAPVLAKKVQLGTQAQVSAAS
jgi:hypothetical protein